MFEIQHSLKVKLTMNESETGFNDLSRSKLSELQQATKDHKQSPLNWALAPGRWAVLAGSVKAWGSPAFTGLWPCIVKILSLVLRCY